MDLSSTQGQMPAAAASAVPASPDIFFDVKGNPVTRLTAETFANPPRADMPWVRWNFPPETATIAELETELQDMVDHNIAGVEIGQGGVPTLEQLVAIYHKANALGIKVSLKAVNGIPTGPYSAGDALARRTLALNKTVVNAGDTFSGVLPQALPQSGGFGRPSTVPRGGIIAVLAYRCTANPCPETGPIELDRSSVQDLTNFVTPTGASETYLGSPTDAALTWSAPPDGGQWLLLTIRVVAFGAQPEVLSLAGTRQLTDRYDAYFAGELGELVKANGGDFFVDSHANDPWGAAEELWSSDMRNEFLARAGYDLMPDLAALFDLTMLGAGFGSAPGPNFSFSDGSGSRIRSDFNRIRSDMYVAYRLLPFQEWAHTYNMKLRLQMEDGPITSIPDQLQTSMVLDRSEYESLTGSDQADIFRPMASANHMTGNTWYSTECCAVLNQSYVQTFEDIIVRMNKEYAGGVTRNVYHIYSYLDSPAWTWPGLGFGRGKASFSNAWNRTAPHWIDAAAMNAYFARMTQVLTQGAAKMDVAVYQRNYSSPSVFWGRDPNNRHWPDLGLQRAGYTWDYLDEALFDLPNAVVTNRRLAENGPAYKTLIFNQFLYPTTNTARGGLTIKAANKILEYAQAGLPIIFVGLPVGTASMPASDDATLRTIVAEILSQPSVSQVASESDVPAQLAALGIQPQAKPAQPTTLLSVRRADAATGTDYYFLYNQGVDTYPGSTSVFGLNPSNLYEAPSTCRYSGAAPNVNPCMATGEPVDTLVTLEGKGAPCTLDAFSGKITPIAHYTRQGETVTVRVKLARDASTIIALSSDPTRFGVKQPEAHVTSTTADGAAVVGSSLVIRASQAGTYEITLDDGRTTLSTIGAVPAAIDLTNRSWHLEVEDWQPLHPYGATGPDGALTAKLPVSVDLPALQSWPDIPELRDASGIGTYTTRISLPAEWDAGYGAMISLGQVTDTFVLTVNGRAISVDQVGSSADIGPHLKPGDNEIRVRVATTLNNRLAALDAAVRDRGVIQNYGLIGPVVVSPYRQAIVWPV